MCLELSDIDKLLNAGFDNQGMHNIALAASFFNYINYLTNSLGIELKGA